MKKYLPLLLTNIEAVFWLVPGLNYNYVARNGDKVWKGTIKVPSEQTGVLI